MVPPSRGPRARMRGKWDGGIERAHHPPNPGRGIRVQTNLRTALGIGPFVFHAHRLSAALIGDHATRPYPRNPARPNPRRKHKDAVFTKGDLVRERPDPSAGYLA
jgi:hypothetical protein